MYCPKCSQQQVSDQTRFCSRCGLLLSNITELLANDGLPAALESRTEQHQLSPRQRGVRQGTALILTGMVISFVMSLLSAFVFGHPEIFITIPSAPFYLSGLARILYVYMFEPAAPFQNEATRPAQLSRTVDNYSLPPRLNVTVPGFGAERMETSEIIVSTGLAEHQTKLLDSK